MTSINIIDRLTGIEFEKIIKEFLADLGFTDLFQTKASRDFGVDIVCNLNKDSYVVQTKRYNRPVNLKSVQEVYAGMKYYQADYCIVVTNNVFTEAAIELAEKCNCKLIDRHDIVEWLKTGFESTAKFFDFLKAKKLKTFRISSDNLIKEYYAIKDKFHKQPTIAIIEKESKYSSSVYRKRWGSWNNFLKSINEALLHNKSITKKELYENFLDIKKQIGKTPTSNEINILGIYSKSTYERHYGSWNKFLKSIGDNPIKKHKISEQEFINEFYKVKSILGHSPSTIEMRKHGNIAPNSYKRLWGSWSNFLKSQGEIYQKRNILESDLVKAYLKLKKLLKKNSLTQKDMNLYGEYSSSVYERRYGSWNKFLNFIGDKPNKIEITSKALIQDYMRVKSTLNKNVLSCNDIRKNGKFSLSTYLKRFNTWKEFLEQMKNGHDT